MANYWVEVFVVTYLNAVATVDLTANELEVYLLHYY